MSGKLDQSLDEILSTQRRNAGQRRPVRRSTGHPAAKPAPVGGIRKTAKPTRNSAVKPGGAKTGGVIGESKVVVSNLVRTSPPLRAPLPDESFQITNCQTSRRTCLRPRSRYVSDEAIPASGTFVDASCRIPYRRRYRTRFEKTKWPFPTCPPAVARPDASPPHLPPPDGSATVLYPSLLGG